MSCEACEARLLVIEDAYNDLLQGFEFWKAWKLSNASGDTTDEMFMRWVEAGDHPR